MNQVPRQIKSVAKNLPVSEYEAFEEARKGILFPFKVGSFNRKELEDLVLYPVREDINFIIYLQIRKIIYPNNERLNNKKPNQSKLFFPTSSSSFLNSSKSSLILPQHRKNNHYETLINRIIKLRPNFNSQNILFYLTRPPISQDQYLESELERYDLFNSLSPLVQKLVLTVYGNENNYYSILERDPIDDLILDLDFTLSNFSSQIILNFGARLGLEITVKNLIEGKSPIDNNNTNIISDINDINTSFFETIYYYLTLNMKNQYKISITKIMSMNYDQWSDYRETVEYPRFKNTDYNVRTDTIIRLMLN